MQGPQNTSTEYCIYLRKSRVDRDAEANGQGDTLARHRKQLMALAKQMELPVTRIYEEVVSGESIAARPEVQKLLADVEAGLWRGVLCMEVERLARGNTSDQGIVADTFKYSDTKIITPIKTYDPSDEYDEEYFEFGLFMSRREYKTINRRLQRGRMASLREGKYIAGAAPYGYEKVKLQGQKGYSLKIVPDKADTVRRIFGWYVNGEPDEAGGSQPMGSQVIAKKLDALGIPSPGGGKWPACTIRDIISNPTYAGMIRWSFRPTVKTMQGGRRVETRPVNRDAEWVQGIHEAIIDRETWDKAQKILRGRAHAPVPKSTQISNPLAGLVYCSRCGRSMLRLPVAAGRKARPSLRCPDPSCPCVSSPLDDVEAAVIEGLRAWLADYKVQLAAGQDATDMADDAGKDAEHLEQTLKTQRKQLDNLYDLVEQGVYTTDVFLRRSQALGEKISATEAALADARERLSAGLRSRKSRIEIVPRVENVLAAYPDLEEPRAKNDLLKSVIDRVIYRKTVGGYRRKSDMTVYVFPKLDEE